MALEVVRDVVKHLELGQPTVLKRRLQAGSEMLCVPRSVQVPRQPKRPCRGNGTAQVVVANQALSKVAEGGKKLWKGHVVDGAT